MALDKTAAGGGTAELAVRERPRFLSVIRREQARTVGYNILSLVLVVLAWAAISRWQHSIYFPSPLSTWTAFTGLAFQGDIEGVSLGLHIWKSLVRIFAGFAAACVLGIPLGLLMGLYPKLYNRTRSIIEPMRFIPPIAWIPVAIVLLSGFSRYAFIIWLGAFFPIFITTLLSVTRVNPIHVNVAKVCGASRSFIIRKIVIPSILPDISTGMRVGLGVAWMCIVAAEMIGGEMVGVGRLILKYAELQRMGEIVVGMLVIGIIGFAMNEVFIVIEKRVFRWRTEVSID